MNMTHPEFNPAAQATFGYTPETIGKEMAKLIILRRSRTAPAGWHVIYPQAKDVLGKRIEITGMRADEQFPVELTITRINGEEPPFLLAFYVISLNASSRRKDRLSGLPARKRQ